MAEDRAATSHFVTMTAKIGARADRPRFHELQNRIPVPRQLT